LGPLIGLIGLIGSIPQPHDGGGVPRNGNMRIGIIGAGMIGSTVAKLWVNAGHEVQLASRHPEALEPLVQALGSRATAGSAAEAAAFGDVVMLTVPLAAVPDLAHEIGSALDGKVVLDTGNAYPKRDGAAAEAASAHPAGSAGWAAGMFPRARWVKAFNTVYFKVLESEAHRSGDRVGIPLASDDPAALEIAAGLVRDAGFDPVIAGALSRGKAFEPGTPPYNTGASGPAVRAMLQAGNSGATASNRT
jgi:predicted dinucleotide-binding enzyme